MPGSGKSTFLAALAHLLCSAELECVLEQVRLSDDEAHLSKLEACWLAGKRVDRTKKISETWVVFHLRRRNDRFEAELAVPDLRGELFEQAAISGRIDASLGAAIIGAAGIVLCLNADVAPDDLTIAEVSAVASALGDDLAPQTEVVVSEFDPIKIPEEAKLVELLQFVNRRGIGESRKRRLAVVVSAWDVVDRTFDENPSAWLTLNRPMLAQFLANNQSLWNPRIYGVSAQGGQLPRDADRLTAMVQPSRRVHVSGPEVLAHDLSCILSWLIGDEGE